MKTHGKHFQTWDDVFHFDFKAENSVSLKCSVSKVETEHPLALLHWTSLFGYETSHQWCFIYPAFAKATITSNAIFPLFWWPFLNSYLIEKSSDFNQYVVNSKML